MEEPDISDEQLSAYIDGELDEASTAKVAASLAQSPELARRAAQFESDKVRISAIFAPLINQPLPADLVRRITIPEPPKTYGKLRFVVTAAAAATLVVLGWFAAPLLVGNPTDRLIAEAIDSRNGTMKTVVQQISADELSPERASRLLRDVLGVPLKLPDLARGGFQLVDLTIYDGPDHQRAVQLKYLNGQGRDFTIFLHRPTGTDKFELHAAGTMRICLWQDDEIAAVMLAQLSTGEMLRVASLTYASLNF